MKTPRTFAWFGPLTIALVTAFILAGCGAGNSEPTVAPEAIFTSAFETFSANMATERAAVTPTLTPQPLPSLLPSPFPSFAAILTQPSFSFASSTPPSSGASADCENKARFVGDVTIPDGTILTPGEDFHKTWLVENFGTCTWTTKYTVEFRDGNQMAGTEEFLPISVPPGRQVEVSVDLEAPDDIGSFYGRWQLHDPDDKPFGSVLTVVIKVAGTAQ